MYQFLGTLFVIGYILYRVFWKNAQPQTEPYSFGRWNYFEIKKLLANEQIPTMLIDLNTLDDNVRRFAYIAKKNAKVIRLATKSIRVPDLVSRILQVGADSFRGLMCYNVREASLLHEHCGVDDILIGYPTIQQQEVERAWVMTAQGCKICLMVDSPKHVEILDNIIEGLKSKPEVYSDVLSWTVSKVMRQPVCIDLDVSWRPLGGLVHIGAHRSPCRTLDDFKAVVDAILASKNLRLGGVMAYEAQIAGVTDKNPFQSLLNYPIRMMKRLSMADVKQKRLAAAQYLTEKRITVDFFNGGGTGSLEDASSESCLTEVTAGSGFLQSTLFDYYESNRNEPAMAMALRVTREPSAGVITCHSGGFISSGSISQDKSPQPFLPKGLAPFKDEGFGEVQTPFEVPMNVRLRIGDPVLVRPSKAGEIAERFEEYMCIKDGEIAFRCKTYRGLGKTFF